MDTVVPTQQMSIPVLVLNAKKAYRERLKSAENDRRKLSTPSLHTNLHIGVAFIPSASKFLLGDLTLIPADVELYGAQCVYIRLSSLLCTFFIRRELVSAVQTKLGSVFWVKLRHSLAHWHPLCVWRIAKVCRVSFFINTRNKDKQLVSRTKTCWNVGENWDHHQHRSWPNSRWPS